VVIGSRGQNDPTFGILEAVLVLASFVGGESVRRESRITSILLDGEAVAWSGSRSEGDIPIIECYVLLEKVVRSYILQILFAHASILETPLEPVFGK